MSKETVRLRSILIFSRFVIPLICLYVNLIVILFWIAGLAPGRGRNPPPWLPYHWRSASWRRIWSRRCNSIRTRQSSTYADSSATRSLRPILANVSSPLFFFPRCQRGANTRLEPHFDVQSWDVVVNFNFIVSNVSFCLRTLWWCSWRLWNLILIFCWYPL